MNQTEEKTTEVNSLSRLEPARQENAFVHKNISFCVLVSVSSKISRSFFPGHVSHI